jgi:phage tail-like protein
MATTVTLPGIALDLVAEDVGDAVHGTVLSGNAEPFALLDGQTLVIQADGGAGQTVAFAAVDFDDITEATAEEVVACINRTTGGLVGASASVDGGKVRLTTGSWGVVGSVQVTGGTANAGLAFDLLLHSGTDFAPVVQLINRLPEPAEVGHPLDGGVALELHDGDGTAPASTGVTVAIDLVLAYDGGAGGFQPGFSGTTSNPDAATLRIVIVPAADFVSDSRVEVDVAEAVSSLAESYAFYTADETPPSVLTATPQTLDVVRIVFAEPVKMTDAAAADDALNPENYEFEPGSVPTVDVVAVSVAAVDAFTVDVTVNVEFAFGSIYEVTVVAVEDLVGNAVSPPTNSASFTSLPGCAPAGRRFLYLELLPQMNRTEDVTGELAMYAACKQDVIWLLLCEIDRWSTILDPDLAPEDFLDAMLADMGNPFRFLELTEVDKRRLLRVLIDIYKLKGTEVGVTSVILFLLGLTVTVDVFNGDGWELAASDNPTLDGQSPPPGPGKELSNDYVIPANYAVLGPGERRLLYTFDIISAVNLTDEQRDRIEDIVDLMKPAHTHLGRIIEPQTEEVIDHLELSLSALGGASTPGNWRLH